MRPWPAVLTLLPRTRKQAKTRYRSIKHSNYATHRILTKNITTKLVSSVVMY